MKCDEAVIERSVAEVCRRCQEETARYRRGEPFDDRFCFDMIRRAVIERDETCWSQLHAIYGEQVHTWCRRRSPNPSTDIDELAAMAWEKFFVAYTPEKLAAAAGSAAVLRYLKMCAQSVAIDAIRAQSGSVSLENAAVDPPDAAPAPGEAQAERAGQAALWEIVSAQLRNERERVLIHLMYDIGLKSAEIQAQRPDLFPEVGEIYRLTRSIHDRLERSPELRAWRDEQRE